ncbi:MAG: hypothetical protein WD649_01815, partial [Thermoleophilaceae bacterium]
FLVILTSFGLSAGVIAKIKGNSFWIFFLIGFALPILGTLVAILYRSERGGLRRACPDCNNMVAVHDQVCTRCGADLDYPDEVYAARS